RIGHELMPIALRAAHRDKGVAGGDAATVRSEPGQADRGRRSLRHEPLASQCQHQFAQRAAVHWAHTVTVPPAVSESPAVGAVRTTMPLPCNAIWKPRRWRATAAFRRLAPITFGTGRRSRALVLSAPSGHGTTTLVSASGSA